MKLSTRIGRRQLLKIALWTSAYGILPVRLWIACGSSDSATGEDTEDGDLAGKNALVIGAGMAGLSAAQRLKEMGADVVLLESHKTAWAGGCGPTAPWAVPLNWARGGFTVPRAIRSAN